MKSTIITLLTCVTLMSGVHLFAQKKSDLHPKIISLPYTPVEGVTYSTKENRYFSKIWDTEVITNTVKPEIWIYEPSKKVKNGTAVIIAPGGGLYAHSIISEGIDVAKSLTQKGITAVILKYRLIPTGKDAVDEISHLKSEGKKKFNADVQTMLPHSIDDGLNAVTYIREHASELGIDPQHIGFMGFSAGGAVTMGVAYNCVEKNRPNFFAPIYPWTIQMPVQPNAPKDSVPMFIACATNDPLQLAEGAIALYTSWRKAGYNTELHMYAKGGHGFGMRTKNTPSDSWIDRFYDWGINEGLILQKD
ncbi:alpha/beta hydrolase [Flammeovirga agarivorans]|nr:alpha/beta hydrolase [Flammeovirga agarivorans]